MTLTVVLDFDHTLIHATGKKPLLQELRLGRFEVDERKKSTGRWPSPVYRITVQGQVPPDFYVKVRPGAFELLEHLHRSKVRLIAYTNGIEHYAKQILAILDPEGKYFSNRLIFRKNESEQDKMLGEVKAAFGGEEKDMIIIDDRLDVWLENDPNVIRVKPYFWFQDGTKKVEQLSNRRLTRPFRDIEKHMNFADEFEHVKTLQVVRDILNAVIKDETRPPAAALAYLQSCVFKGKTFVFSGVFPRKAAEEPHEHPLWREIEKFGGKCTSNWTAEVTHLVMGGREMTEKYNQAVNKNIEIVDVPWVLGCLAQYKLLPELDHESILDPTRDTSSPRFAQAPTPNSTSSAHLRVPYSSSEQQRPISSSNVIHQPVRSSGSTLPLHQIRPIKAAPKRQIPPEYQRPSALALQSAGPPSQKRATTSAKFARLAIEARQAKKFH